MMRTKKARSSDLVQGTLDMLILKILARGYALEDPRAPAGGPCRESKPSNSRPAGGVPAKSGCATPRAHGYAIAEAIHLRSDDVLRVEEAALYPALHRLELRGLLAAEWGTSDNNRRAKFYWLTARGHKHLASESTHWSRLSAAIARVMET